MKNLKTESLLQTPTLLNEHFFISHQFVCPLKAVSHILFQQFDISIPRNENEFSLLDKACEVLVLLFVLN